MTTRARSLPVAGNQLPELLIFFEWDVVGEPESWESVTRTLDILCQFPRRAEHDAGNQLPELLIFFAQGRAVSDARWESVTRTLDILYEGAG